MNRMRCLVACLAVLVAVLPAAAQSGPSELERIAAEFRSEHGVPSVVVGTLSPGGSEYVALGEAGLDTRFEIGSVTKPVVGLLLAEMAIRGEVELDDPLVDFLAPPASGNPALSQIRLYQLATHGSGLPRLPPNLFPAPLTDPYSGYDAERLEEALAALEGPLEPGTYEYSNLGAGVLGHALARHAGLPLAHLIRDRVTGPLGLRNTGYAEETGCAEDRGYAEREGVAPGSGPGIPASSEPPAVAPPHRGGEEIPAWRFTSLSGAGGLWSSARDLMELVQWQLEPPEGLLGEAIRESHRIRADGPAPARMALAWHVLEMPPVGPVYLHTGATGGSRSFVAFAPDAGVGVVILLNSDVPLERVDGLAASVIQLVAVTARTGNSP